MNRTLRRPMFRMGGSAEGITSGLSMPRQGYKDAKLVEVPEEKGAPISQDLIDDAYKARVHPGLFKGEFKFGDTLRVESKTHSSMNGLWVVRDCMNRRYKNSMDFLLPLKGKRILGRDFKISKKY